MFLFDLFYSLVEWRCWSYFCFGCRSTCWQEHRRCTEQNRALDTPIPFLVFIRQENGGRGAGVCSHGRVRDWMWHARPWHTWVGVCHSPQPCRPSLWSRNWDHDRRKAWIRVGDPRLRLKDPGSGDWPGSSGLCRCNRCRDGPRLHQGGTWGDALFHRSRNQDYRKRDSTWWGAA